MKLLVKARATVTAGLANVADDVAKQAAKIRWVFARAGVSGFDQCSAFGAVVENVSDGISRPAGRIEAQQFRYGRLRG